MLRLLGFVFLVIICVDTAPWGLVVGAVVCAAWLLSTPASAPKLRGAEIFENSGRAANAHKGSLSAIPLVNAVYCANCDAITDSPHDSCGSCGSHSVIAVSRLWHLTVTHARVTSTRYKVSFTADVREIPATELGDTIKLITSLAELGGNLKAFHIQVEAADAANALAEGRKIELVKPVTRSANAWDGARRQAS